MSRFRSLVLACVFGLTPACGASLIAPSSPDGLVLTGSIDTATVPSGGTATLSFRLTNSTSTAKTLKFNSGCQLMVYIVNRHTNGVVYPPGGSWACAASLTQLDLPAGGSKTEDVKIQSATIESYPYVPVFPGDYTAYAKLDGYGLQSDNVTFTVR